MYPSVDAVSLNGPSQNESPLEAAMNAECGRVMVISKVGVRVKSRLSASDMKAFEGSKVVRSKRAVKTIKIKQANK